MTFISAGAASRLPARVTVVTASQDGCWHARTRRKVQRHWLRRRAKALGGVLTVHYFYKTLG